MQAPWRSIRAWLGATLVTGALLATIAAPASAAVDITQVAGGYESVCALRSDGGVSCWADNEHHQMGDGTTDPRPDPVRVTRAGGALLTGARRLVAGSSHYCTLQRDATVRCWGRNTDGQIGVGHADPVLRAERVLLGGKPMGGVTALAAGSSHTCALLRSGRVRCWGDNEFSQVGDGTKGQDRHEPVLVKKAGGGLLQNVTSISAGGSFTCAALAGGTVRCWGYNIDGQIGDGTTETRPRAVPVRRAGGGAFTGVRTIDAGGDVVCAIRGADRQVWCWGDGGDQQLGNGHDTDRPHPTRMRRGSGFMTGVSSVSVDYGHTCLLRSRTAWCVGQNWGGMIGDGTLSDRPLPVRVHATVSTLSPATWSSIATTDGGTCGVRAHRAWCWGSNDADEAGPNGTLAKEPLPLLVPIP